MLLWREGEIELRDAPPDLARAEVAFGQALELVSALEMRPLVARCHLGLGQVLRRNGQPDRAREHLATAAEMCRQMAMRPWLAQAEQETKELA